MKLYFFLIAIFAGFMLHADVIYKISYNHKKEEISALNDMVAMTKIRDWIICREIESNDCIIESEKIKIIAHKLLAARNVTYENFCIPNQKFMKKIHNGLLKVLLGNSPTAIYNSDITTNTMPEEIWMQYVSQYNTKEKVEEYVKDIPSSMDVVIKSFYPQAKFFAERWLLYDRIIKSFNLKYTSLPDAEAQKVEKEWWNRKMITLEITAKPEIPKERVVAIKKNILNSITARINLGEKSELIFLECLGK